MSLESEHLGGRISALTSKTGRKILEIIALNGPITMYRVSETPPGPAVSLVHKYVKGDSGLEELGLVKSISTRRWRTGLKSSEYILTFQGFLYYLAMRTEKLSGSKDWETKKEGIISDIKKVIINNRRFFNHPILDNLEFLEKTFGTERCFLNVVMASRVHALRRISEFLFSFVNLEEVRKEARKIEQLTPRTYDMKGFDEVLSTIEEIAKADFSFSFFTHVNLSGRMVLLDQKYKDAIMEPLRKLSENQTLRENAQKVHKFINVLLGITQERVDNIFFAFRKSVKCGSEKKT